MPGKIRGWGGSEVECYIRKDRERGRCGGKTHNSLSSESSIRTMMNGLVIQCVKIWVNRDYIRAGPKQRKLTKISIFSSR